MDRKYAPKLARLLMRMHGLVGWRFEIVEHAESAYGLCDIPARKILLLEKFVIHSLTPQFVEVMLHEIAHALVGIEHDHDSTWKQKCKELGIRPLARTDCCIPERYQAFCPKCGEFFTRTRKPSGAYRCLCSADVEVIYTDVSLLENPEQLGFKRYK